MSTSQGPVVRIFVSHSHQDNEFGVRLVADLRRALGDENAVWYDASGGLHGGDAWWTKIRQELRERSVFLVILSPNSVASPWVSNEIDLAWKQRNSPAGKTILPVLYLPCQVRDDLEILQIVSFLPPKRYEDALEEVLASLGIPLPKDDAAAKSSAPAQADDKPVELDTPHNSGSPDDSSHDGITTSSAAHQDMPLPRKERTSRPDAFPSKYLRGIRAHPKRSASVLLTTLLIVAAISLLLVVNGGHGRTTAGGSGTATVGGSGTATADGSATTTASAQAALAASSTATAFATTRYVAPAPGPGCDTGGATWTTAYRAGVGCLSDRLRLSGQSTSTGSDNWVEFSTPFPTISFPTNYAVSVEMSNIAPGTYFSIAVRTDDAAYTFDMEPNDWQVFRVYHNTSDNGNIPSGSYNRAVANVVTITLSGATRSFALNGQQVASFQETAPSRTVYIELEVSAGSGSPIAQADFRDFTFVPSP